MASITLRPSMTSTATRIRICGAIWITPPPTVPGSVRRDRAPWRLSTGCASCHAALPTQSGTPTDRARRAPPATPPTPESPPTPARASQRVWPIPPCASACHTPGAGSWRCGRPHVPEPPSRRTPTRPWESASAHGANSASARSAGKSSPCQPEPQAVSWWSSSVLPSPAGTTTDATTYGRAPSYRLTESSREFEKVVFETPELLQDIFLLKRQIRGGNKTGIPDIVGLDSDGNVCIIEMKNVTVDASIVPQVLEYA